MDVQAERPSDPGPVCAVVLARRGGLLERCLAALRDQARPPEHIVVVAEQAVDGTAAEDVDLVRVEESAGRPAAFRAGLERALRATPAAWIWMMDDETLPARGALEALLAPLADLGSLPRPALLASKVVWRDEELHPRDAPWPRWRKDRDVTVSAAAKGLLSVRATTYVSIVVARGALERSGMPDSRYPVAGDDIEFTARLLRREAGYLVPGSLVRHETADNLPAPRAGRSLYRHDVRSKVLMMRDGVWTDDEKLWLTYVLLREAVEHLRHNRFSPRSAAAVARGVIDGLVEPARRAGTVAE